MNEIKFRAWDKRNKKWTEQESLVMNNGLLYEDWRAFEDGEPLSEDDAELVQYTGLKDKKGTEIFEGDIVKDIFENIFKVSFNPEFCAYFLYPTENPEEFMAIYPKIILTVIGNRFENPELTKEEPTC